MNWVEKPVVDTVGCIFCSGNSTLRRQTLLATPLMPDDHSHGSYLSPEVCTSQFLAILGFPNHSPSFANYADFLPIFCGEVGDNTSQHLIQFHWSIDRLKIYHEDSLIKLFVYSLNDDAWSWYRSLSTANISSLQYFHVAFLRYCKKLYPSDVLLEGCCKKFKYHIQPKSDLVTWNKSADASGEGDSKMESVYWIA